ncbi:MAG: NapC/NirT family cytochrome c [Nitrospirae bacterium]|nr:NapC/NirT family cytochrome c [Nitrospirota bacterium]
MNSPIFTYFDYLIITILSAGLFFAFLCLYSISRKGTDAKTVFIFCGFLILAVWPLGFSAVSIYNLERAKTVAFCGSCHEMQERVADLRNPASKNLSSKHATRFWINENACYNCHTDYTMFGPFTAKWRGLQHMYAAAFIRPKPEEIKIYVPFPDRNCIRCHRTARFDRVEEHGDRDPDERCVDCHDKIHPRPGAKGGEMTRGPHRSEDRPADRRDRT